MIKIKKLLMLVVIMLSTLSCLAQEKTEMADTMRSNGRIYVVVAVVVTILLGLVLYLVRLDRKMGKLERENRH